MNNALSLAILQHLHPMAAVGPVASGTSFSERDWKQALEWLDWSGLAIYFHKAIQSSNALIELPDQVKNDLERRAVSNTQRTTEMLGELQHLTSAFDGRGIPYALLKGIALTPEYCPNPALRTQYDHDILVDAASLSRMDEVLTAEGYHRKAAKNGESTVVYRRPDPAIRFSQTAEALYSPRLNRSIELHLCLWEESDDRIRIPLPTDFLQRVQQREWQGLRYTALRDEDELFFQVLHAFKHVLRNWCRLSVFLEIAHFLRQRSGDSTFWEKFSQRIGNVPWARDASLVVFTLCEKLFGSSIPGGIQAALNTQLSGTLTLWIEEYGRRAALSNFHDDKCSLFLHREFVDTAQEWQQVLRRRLFPVQRTHRPPAVIFQRSFSAAGRIFMERMHTFRRMKFHAWAGLRYTVAYPRWLLLRRMAMAAPNSGRHGHV